MNLGTLKLGFKNSINMRLVFYGLLLLLFFATVFYGDKKVRKDQYCKEGLFYQMLLNKCTPRDFLLKDEIQEDI